MTIKRAIKSTVLRTTIARGTISQVMIMGMYLLRFVVGHRENIVCTFRHHALHFLYMINVFAIVLFVIANNWRKQSDLIIWKKVILSIWYNSEINYL